MTVFLTILRVRVRRLGLLSALAISGAVFLASTGMTPAKADVSSFCTSVGATAISGTNDCLKAFTSAGSSSWTVPSGITSIQYLVVGGGGGGQNGIPSGGAVSKGGAGGTVRQSSSSTVASGATLTVAVGAGGNAGSGTGGTSSIAGGGLNVTAGGGSGGTVSGVGSAGTANSITGTSLVYGSGGGATGSAGGSGAGNGSAQNSWSPGGAGVANRGGGGGAGSPADLMGSWSATGGGAGGSGVVYIRFTAAVAPSVTASTAPTGTRQVGSTLTSATTYSAVPAPTMTYQWQVCTNPSDVTTCSDISGATSATFTPTGDQVGQYVRVRTTATNDSGVASDDSPMVGHIGMPTTGSPSMAASSDLGPSNSDRITSDTTPTMQTTGLVIGATVTMSASNGTDTITCSFVATATTGGCDLPSLTDGSWNVTTTQSINGVSSTASSPTSITIDTAPPGPLAYSLTSGGASLADGGVTSTNAISFASGPTSSGSSTISCSLDGGAAQTPCPSSFTSLSAGDHTITFTAVDSAGNQSTDTFSFSYLGQTSASLASESDTGASNSDRITSDTTPQINISGLVTGATVTVSATSGSQTKTCTFVATASTGGCSLPILSDGAWSVTSEQSLGGVSTTPSSAVTLTVDTAAPSVPGAPTATPTGGTPVANVIAADTTGVTLSASITAGEATGGRAEFYLDGVLIGTDSSISAGDTSVSIAPSLASLAASGALSVRLFDAAGNSVNSSATNLTVDRSVPSVSSFTAAAGQNLNTATEPMTFDLVMSEPIFGLTGADFTNAGTATGCVFTPSASSGTNFSVTVSGCSAGTVRPSLTAGTVSDGVNAGPATNSAVGSGDAVNFVTTAPTGGGVPTLSATAGSLTTLGSTLASTGGTWNDQGDSTATTTYRWQVCTNPADASSCTDISGATSATFIPDASMDGAYVRSVTTRTNVAGVSTPQASSMTGPMTRSAQTISFTGPTTQTFSTAPVALGGTTSSGLAVAYTSLTPGVCSVSGSELTMLSSGTCTVEAAQAGNGMYLAATPVQQSFTVNRASQTIALTTPSQVVPVGSALLLAAAAPGGGAITYSVTSGGAYCSISGSVLVSTGAGDCTVEASIAQDGPYLAATSAPVTFQSRISRTASLSVPVGALLTDGSVEVQAGLSTGGTPGVFAGPPEVCRASGTTILLVGNGECYVSASAPADGVHTAADSGTQVFRVGGPPAAPVISAVAVNGTTASVSISSGGLGSATSIDSYTVTATPRGGGAPVTVTCTSSPCSVPGLSSGTQYDFSAVANGRVGQMPVTSDPSSYGPVDVFAPSTIVISAPSREEAGRGSFAISVSSSLGDALTLTFTSNTPGVCSVTATGRVTVVAAGLCSITAGHAGGVVGGIRYSPASQTATFRVPGPGGWSSGDDAAVPEAESRPAAPSSVVISRQADGTPTATARFRAPMKGRTTVVFILTDALGNVVGRMSVDVPAGSTTARVRLPDFAEGMTVRAFAETSVGRSRAVRSSGTYIHAGTMAQEPGTGAWKPAGIRVAKALLFGPDSDVLTPAAKVQLGSVARTMGDRGGVLLVSGFVRNGGGDRADQLDLANRRALAVARHLASTGVSAQIRYDGIGAVTKTLGTPDHRRVEVRWVSDASGLRSVPGQP